MGYNYILEEVREVLKQREKELNNMNVFPLPDKDTGSNFCKTLSVEIADRDDPKEYIKNLAHQMVWNAYGSSGNIISLFMLELAQRCDTDSNLYDMFIGAANGVKEHLYNFREGGIPSIMLIGPNEAYKDDFHLFLKSYIERGIDYLRKAPEVLTVLKDNNVLDSGSVGFLYILGSIYKTLYGEDLTSSMLGNPRYCIEATLTSDSEISKNRLEDRLKLLGNELIVIRLNNITKLHIHSNDYPEVLKVWESIPNCKVKKLKVEDTQDNNRIIMTEED